MKRGSRIYYNQKGIVLFQAFEVNGDVPPHLESEEIFYIDLEYGDKTLENAEKWHVENRKLVVDKFIQNQETEQEKLLREKKELENQLIISENKNIGGIL